MKLKYNKLGFLEFTYRSKKYSLPMEKDDLQKILDAKDISIPEDDGFFNSEHEIFMLDGQFLSLKEAFTGEPLVCIDYVYPTFYPKTMFKVSHFSADHEKLLACFLKECLDNKDLNSKIKTESAYLRMVDSQLLFDCSTADYFQYRLTPKSKSLLAKFYGVIND